MGETSEEFRRVYLPYCIEQVEGGGHVVLNRLYKPLGISSRDRVDYAAHACTLKGLGPAKAARLSWDGSESLERIYLYNDGCVPTESPANWAAYQARLEVLAKLKVT